jgi:transcription elongation factor Elf1
VIDEDFPDFQDHPFTCPYCGKETMVQSPLDAILIGRATCDCGGREFLIGNDVPTQLPN